MNRRFGSITIGLAVAFAMAPSTAFAGDPAKTNIVTAAVASKDHQTLVGALKTAGLADTLAGKGPFTVFAPTDAAFSRLPAGTVDKLVEPASRDQLRAVLTYHVVPGRITSADLVKAISDGGGKATLKTVQGGTITASLSGRSVVLTDATGGTATVTKADLVQSNGVIHITDAVSLPM